jgi:hypothetical protein
MLAPKVAKPSARSAAGAEPGARQTTNRQQEALGQAFADKRAAVLASEDISGREVPRGVAWSFSKIPLFPPDRAGQSHASHWLPGIIQPKLAIGQVSYPLEHETDRVADRVTRMPVADEWSSA